jgi:hypothetical protein
MKYLLTLYGVEGMQPGITPEEMAAGAAAWFEYGRKLTEAGAFIAGEGLAESATATTLHVGGNGEQVVTDGPFAETKEQLGGFYLLDCKDLDEALDWARQVPLQGGAVEIRPVMDYEAVGFESATEAKG